MIEHRRLWESRIHEQEMKADCECPLYNNSNGGR